MHLWSQSVLGRETEAGLSSWSHDHSGQEHHSAGCSAPLPQDAQFQGGRGWIWGDPVHPVNEKASCVVHAVGAVHW